MNFPLLKTLRRTDTAVVRDADELMQLWGHAAYERATDLSWREDSGLTSSPRPGHWWSVRREIGRRLGHSDREPSLDIAA